MNPDILSPDNKPANQDGQDASQTLPAETSGQPTGQPSQNLPAKKRSGKNWLAVLVVAIIVLVAGLYLVFGRGSSNNSQNQGKVYKIGILDGLDSFFGETNTGFKQKMTQLGYVEGKNVTYYIEKTPTPAGNQNIIKKFIQDKVDLVLSYPTEASLEAKSVLKGTGIPIVFTNAAAEGNSLINSIQSPGENITGVRYPVPEVAVKRLDTLHQLVPKAKRIWLPVQKDYPSVPAAVDAVNKEAKSLNVTVTESQFADTASLKAYLAKLPSTGDVGMDAILEVAEPLSVAPDEYTAINQFAVKHKLPIAGSVPLSDASSPIFAIATDAKTVGELAAPIADKILKGTPAGSIPVATPSGYMVVNLKAMQRLGITPGEGFLSTADKIIK